MYAISVIKHSMAASVRISNSLSFEIMFPELDFVPPTTKKTKSRNGNKKVMENIDKCHQKHVVKRFLKYYSTDYIHLFFPI
jgi:hypothetical protein